MRNRQVFSESEIEEAVSFLTNSAPVIAEARGRMTKADSMLGHIEAIEMQRSKATSAVWRKADARASDSYLAAIDERAAATAEFEKLPRKPAPGPTFAESLPQEARERLAILELDAVRDRYAETGWDQQPADEWWQYVLTFLGLPVGFTSASSVCPRMACLHSGSSCN